MTYAIVAFLVWLLWFPAAYIVFYAWGSLMEWLADEPERRDA